MVLCSVVVFAQAGRVGINIETPTATLNVKSKTGTTSATKNLELQNADSKNLLEVLDNGDIKINAFEGIGKRNVIVDENGILKIGDRIDGNISGTISAGQQITVISDIQYVDCNESTLGTAYVINNSTDTILCLNVNGYYNFVYNSKNFIERPIYQETDKIEGSVTRENRDYKPPYEFGTNHPVYTRVQIGKYYNLSQSYLHGNNMSRITEYRDEQELTWNHSIPIKTLTRIQ